MPTSIILEDLGQSEVENVTEIASDFFGANLLATYNQAFEAEISDHVMEIVDLIGANNLRYPGGSITEDLFDIQDIENTVENGHSEGDAEQLVPFSTFIEVAAELNSGVNLVIPTRNGFTQSAFEALESGDYGNRQVSDEYLEDVRDYIRDTLAVAGENGVEITALEIGNEFWGAGRMTASEYGQLASAVIEVIVEEIGTSSSINILVQGVVGSGAYSPNVRPDNTAIVEDELGNTFEVPHQGRAPEQNGQIIETLNSSGMSSHVNGLVSHYYLTRRANLNDNDSDNDVSLHTAIEEQDYIFDNYLRWIRDLGTTAELELHITEWNARQNDSLSYNRGLQLAATIVEQVFEMAQHGVDVAHIWPLVQSSVTSNTQSTTIGWLGGDGLSVAGEMFALMSTSLIGMTPFLEINQEQISVHGYEDLDSMVLFVTEQGGIDRHNSNAVQLDLTEILGGRQIYDLAGVGLTISGIYETDDARSEPEIFYLSYDELLQGYQNTITIDLDDWSTIRLEFSFVTQGLNLTDDEGDTEILGTRLNDSIDGNSGADTIFGHGGDDFIEGGIGEDLLHGNRGDDTIIGGLDDDTIFSGSGDDEVEAGYGTDWVELGQGDDVFIDMPQSGPNGSDTIFGEAGDDLIIGGGGENLLSGGDGEDTIIAGTENDTLNGGQDADTFVFNLLEGSHTVSEFETGLDLIDLTGLSLLDVQVASEIRDDLDIIFCWAVGDTTFFQIEEFAGGSLLNLYPFARGLDGSNLQIFLENVVPSQLSLDSFLL